MFALDGIGLVVLGLLVPLGSMMAACSIWLRARRRLSGPELLLYAEAVSFERRYMPVLVPVTVAMCFIEPIVGAAVGLLLAGGSAVWSVRKIAQLGMPRSFLHSHLVAMSLSAAGFGAGAALVAYCVSQQALR